MPIFRRALLIPLLGMLGLASLSAQGQNVDVKKTDHLKVVYSASVPNLQDIQIFAARDAGIYKKYGLDVDLISINGATAAFQSLMSGDADVVFLDPTHLLVSWEKGQHLKGIVNASPTQPYLLLGQGSLGGLKDLAGKRIGISAPGTLSQTIVQMALSRHNIDQKNIQWLPVGGSGPRYQALVSKRIDAGISQTNYAIRGEREAGLKVLADLGKELPDLMGYILAAKDDTIATKRPAMVKFVAAILETTRRVESDPAFAAKYYMAYQKQALLADVLKEHALLKASGAWGTGGTLRQDAIDFTAKMMQSEEKFKGAPKLDSVFDSSVFEDGEKLAASMK